MEHRGLIRCENRHLIDAPVGTSLNVQNFQSLIESTENSGEMVLGVFVGMWGHQNLGI